MKTLMFVSFCIALSGALLSYEKYNKRKGNDALYDTKEAQFDGFALAGFFMLIISTCVWAAS